MSLNSGKSEYIIYRVLLVFSSDSLEFAGFLDAIDFQINMFLFINKGVLQRNMINELL